MGSYPMNQSALHIFRASLLSLAACSDGFVAGSGSLGVLLEQEDIVVKGIEPGLDSDNIRDGWTVLFSKYIVAVGNVSLVYATDDREKIEMPTIQVVDIRQLPAQGETLWRAPSLRAGRWQFSYQVPAATVSAMRHPTVTQSDFDAMVASQSAYAFSGSIARVDGVSCPPASVAIPGDKPSTSKNARGETCYANPKVGFTWFVPAATAYGPCEVDDKPGFAITDGASTSVAITLHGDHLFFNGFPEGHEALTMRLSQWLADCDLNLDGTVTSQELQSIVPSLLSEIDDRFLLGASPITPLSTMWDYVRAQFKTQGHFQGEGECPIADNVRP
jgi:hypothetical protein